jgi:tetratricopeptide (TPR) repeat protein
MPRKAARKSIRNLTRRSSASVLRPDRILKEAADFYFQRKPEKAICHLRKVDIKSKAISERQKRSFYRLWSFSHANAGMLAEAETAALEGSTLFDNDYDFYFVLAYVSISYKDYEKCLEYARRFFGLYDLHKDKPDNNDCLSNGHLHLIHNYVGMASQARNDFTGAEESFLRAIDANPVYNHPYLNLADLYRRRKEYDKAKEIVDRGLRCCSQIQELRIFQKSLQNRTTVSACLIVKNEEELLPDCLKSIRDWVDEIVVVDTGSGDGTVAIAKSYGARVFHQAWSKDFSRHRNYSISKATGDWIFIIDADEEFEQEDIPLLRQAISQNDYRIISINVFNMNRRTGEYTSFLPSNRLFRRNAGFYYEGIVHNQLKFDRSEAILRAGIRIKHYGYSLSPEKMKAKLARSRELLEIQLRERPDDPYVHFNYAQLLRGLSIDPDPETCDLIIRHARRALELSDTDRKGTLHIHLQAHHQIITTLIHQKKFPEAEKLCLRALELKPDYLDPILSLGHIYAGLRKFDKAEEYFGKYLAIQETYQPSAEIVNLILLYVRARHIAYYGLGLIKQFQGLHVEAEEYYLKALQEQEPYADIYSRLTRLYLDRREWSKALKYIDKELALNPDSDLAHLYKAQYYASVNEPAMTDEYLDKAIQLTEGNPEVYERAGCYWANVGRFDKAVSSFEELVRLKPDYPPGLKLLAKAYYDSGDYGNSLSSYRRYLDISENDAGAVNDLANCHFKMGDYENAELQYTRALSLDSSLSASYRNLGLTKSRLGKQKEALALLENYLQIVPEDLEIEFIVGSVYLQSREFAQAILHLEKFLKGNPSHVQGLFSISECYYHLGYKDSAAIGYKQILRLDKTHQDAIYRLAELEGSQVPA